MHTPDSPRPIQGATTMQTITVNEAVGQALAEEMRRDPRVLMFGEGVATKRADLLAEFGAARVRNTPLAEGIIAGTAAGAAALRASNALGSFELPLPTEHITISQMWHPRLDRDPAHRWLRRVVLEVCRQSHANLS